MRCSNVAKIRNLRNFANMQIFFKIFEDKYIYIIIIIIIIMIIYNIKRQNSAQLRTKQ